MQLLGLVLSHQSVRLQQGSIPAAHFAFLNSLSGASLKILAHIFIWHLSPTKVNLWSSFSFGPLLNHSAFASANKLSGSVLSILDWCVLWPSVTSKQYKLQSQSKFAADRQHISFYPLSREILHLIPRNERERGRESELQLLSPSHTGSILISAQSSCSPHLDR